MKKKKNNKSVLYDRDGSYKSFLFSQRIYLSISQSIHSSYQLIDLLTTHIRTDIQALDIRMNITYLHSFVTFIIKKKKIKKK